MGIIIKNRTSRGRRRVAAALAGMALPLVLACWSASAGTVLPSQSAGAQDATPCPVIVVGTPDPSCGVGGGVGGSSPSPAPTSSAGGATPTPSSSSSSGDSGGGTGGSGGGGGQPSAAAAPGSSAAATASASASAAAANINPPALLGLLTVLNAPANVGVERPLLHHFAVGGDTTVMSAPLTTRAAGSAATGRQPGGSGSSAGLTLALLCALGAGGAAVVAGRRFAIVDQRRRVIAALPLAGVGVIGAVMLGAHPAPAPVAAAPHRAVAVAVAVGQHHVDAVVAPVFQQLTAIESDITTVAQRLTLVASSASTGDDAQPSLGVARGAARQRLAQQLAGDLAARYATDLQNEYSFFTTVVADDAQRTQLLTAAAAASAPVAEAVTYNVTAVQAMLQQEAAITAAQAAAQTVKGPAPTSLLAPEQGFLAQGFGPSQYTIEPPLTFNGVTYPHFHTGIDIANVLDTPVHAADDGVVVIAGSSLDSKGNLIGYGNYVVIQHAGHMITLYAHLDKLLVKPGQVVKQGDVIGLEGSTGYSTGPHLHFEVRINGLLADPMTYLGKQLGPVA